MEVHDHGSQPFSLSRGAGRRDHIVWLAADVGRQAPTNRVPIWPAVPRNRRRSVWFLFPRTSLPRRRGRAHKGATAAAGAVNFKPRFKTPAVSRPSTPKLKVPLRPRPARSPPKPRCSRLPCRPRHSIRPGGARWTRRCQKQSGQNRKRLHRSDRSVPRGRTAGLKKDL